MERPPSIPFLKRHDMVLIGGSGDYSVAEGGPWLEPALDVMRELADFSIPTFASCWGFQAIAKAYGGDVVTDLSRAELGTLMVRLTDEGKRDPLFGELPTEFPAPLGHQDIVDSLPENAILLASTDRVAHQAFRLKGKPIYGTQFHPELRLNALLERVTAYPEYVEKIRGLSIDEFSKLCVETYEVQSLLRRFVAMVFSS